MGTKVAFVGNTGCLSFMMLRQSCRLGSQLIQTPAHNDKYTGNTMWTEVVIVAITVNFHGLVCYHEHVLVRHGIYRVTKTEC
ncbi:unnamed protein product [Allacma fusca]|uniref:Uncharacterized protein n=1 Tax=Allacma fusca TaxID=39272 RepID=A0A8J2NU11_9HEXA|nr:unnamed protein product [Allacma fusca]